MKRQQIDVEELPFPSGIATAQTLTALHARGADAEHKARALGGAGLFGALVSWFRDAHAQRSAPPSRASEGGSFATPA